MKTILIFIGLKFIEIGGFCLMCYVGYQITGFTKYLKHESWGERVFVGVLILWLTGVIIAGIVILLIKNWEWAVKLA